MGLFGSAGTPFSFRPNRGYGSVRCNHGQVWPIIAIRWRCSPFLAYLQLIILVVDDPAAAYETLKAWMESQPTGIEGRRQMPQFNLTEQEMQDLTEFLLWVNTIKTQGWPPNDAG